MNLRHQISLHITGVLFLKYKKWAHPKPFLVCVFGVFYSWSVLWNFQSMFFGSLGCSNDWLIDKPACFNLKNSCPSRAKNLNVLEPGGWSGGEVRSPWGHLWSHIQSTAANHSRPVWSEHNLNQHHSTNEHNLIPEVSDESKTAEICWVWYSTWITKIRETWIQ